MRIASEKNVENQRNMENLVIFSQEGQEQDNYVNKTQLLLIILEYIIRNIVPGITSCNQCHKLFNSQYLPPKMLFSRSLEIKES